MVSIGFMVQRSAAVAEPCHSELMSGSPYFGAAGYFFEESLDAGHLPSCNLEPGRNFTIFRAAISSMTPVRGLRPVRAGRSWV